MPISVETDIADDFVLLSWAQLDCGADEVFKKSVTANHVPLRFAAGFNYVAFPQLG